MTVKASHCTPMLQVKEVERSIDFYSLLGFTKIATDGLKPLGWARMQCEGGALMFARAEEALDPRAQAVMFYLYTPDLPAFREHLLGHGLDVSPIGRPPYMPSGEICVRDPDGYTLLVGHWGEQEHADWLRKIAQSPP